ncbi:MAG: redoxin family protein [Limisphaerales bacterium]
MDLRLAKACVALLAALALAGCAGPEAGAPPELFAAPAADLDAKPLVISPAGHDRALVLIFTSVDCPIANRAVPELRALANELAPQGVRFVLVYANTDETAAAIRRHQAEFAPWGQVVRDPEGALVARFGVRVTPEAAAVTHDGQLIYQGRVNDQYAAPGVGRPAPTRHDLADALREFLKTGEARGRRAPAAGCAVRPAA